MTRDEFNAFCAGFPATSHVIQWGNADVWKVADKVFAICGWADGRDAFTFKVTDFAFEILPDMPGIRPAPYLASRGMKWVQVYDAPGLPEDELKEHIALSYQLVAEGISKKKRRELGIPVPGEG
ncbi:MmcQ/YjbR family DNA-binding protein [Shimia biformata]|uniref:MmcQ/YjbR family DNA-binding protein n=1 Tax=Shimia biformata TaxID=1294299 RepID=UPI00194ECFA1|nr:MmcQ/YjbR family DNA-binding protein [Shimia biformata]